MSISTQESTHVFDIKEHAHRKELPYGTRFDVSAKEMPVLEGMALSMLELAPKGVREPHWHPNANELSYCLEGKGMMTLVAPGNKHYTLAIAPGTLAMAPKGYLHHIENSGDVPMRLLVCFDNESFDELDLSPSVGIVPSNILGDLYGQQPAIFEKLSHTVEATFIARQEEPTLPSAAFETSPFKLDLEAMQPQLQNDGGSVKMSNNFLFPALEGLALYSLNLRPGGVREPHWHPNAAELNVLFQGKARIRMLSPGGHVETFDMHPGSMSFIPRGYFHYIENIGDEEVRFAVFFNHTAPSDIGLGGCLGAYSSSILAALFKCAPSFFDTLPKFQRNLLIVKGGG